MSFDPQRARCPPVAKPVPVWHAASLCVPFLPRVNAGWFYTCRAELSTHLLLKLPTRVLLLQSAIVRARYLF